MPVFRLPKQPVFPPPAMAEENGLLAIGGDLSPQRLLAAYSAGIFPWYSEGEPLLWWSPDPRLVLYPEQLRRSRSLRKTLRRHRFAVTFDQIFPEVIRTCSQQRQTTGTWITPEMEQAYIQLHQMGYAHSVEVWWLTDEAPVLAGGLYGVALGGCFFGESMFHHYPDGSKIALVALVERLCAQGYSLLDCQMATPHLLRFGAQEIPRLHFLAQLDAALQIPTQPRSWCQDGGGGSYPLRG